jgi:glutamate synthase domain-containing protein 2
MTSLIRFLTLAGFATATPLLAWAARADEIGWWWSLLSGLLTAVGAYDLLQTRHAILRNYPVFGHLRFMFEAIRPEIRQYLIESDNDAVPFSRLQRALVYQRAKQESDKQPFGTQLDTYASGFEWMNHAMVPAPLQSHDFRVTVGGPQCARPYEASIFNISAMSFGSLSANAIRALNRGAKRGGFAHDTGEGSISAYHREFGGDLIWEIGSGYFGARDESGRFDRARFVENACDDQVKMIEVKLSQGAKPGHGGVLPGPKVTPEIAAARGVPPWVDCVSPASHSAFSTPIGLLEFIDELRRLSGGKPTGFKFAVGHPWEWFAIAKAMRETGITPDFIVIDGKEGGTGAAPAEFIDRVGMPMREGLMLVHDTLVGLNLRSQIRLGAAGKLTSAFDIARTMAMGADWCNSARGFMFAVGCIQAMNCHTGRCPTGVTTQDAARQRALVVPDKADRVFNFHENTLKALAELIAAAGLTHPSQLDLDHIMRRVTSTDIQLLSTIYPMLNGGELIDGLPDRPVYKSFWEKARPDSFSPGSAPKPAPHFF